MQVLQKELKEFMDKTFQKGFKEFIDKINKPINIWPNDRRDRKIVMERKLKLATWNTNRLAKHPLEDKAFILSQDIDILLVSETHFTNKNFLRIPGYTLYHTMHPDSKTYGGTAIIIRSSIKHYEIDKHQRDFLQTISVMMETWNGCITISAVHSPSKHVTKSEQYIKFLETLGKRSIAAGDYNA